MAEEIMRKIELGVLFLMMLLTAAMAGFAFAVKTQDAVMFTLGWMIFVGVWVTNIILVKIYRRVR